MSAITGIIHFHNEPVSYHDGLKMMQSLQMFPADYTGTWREGSIFLGCHAQWITPESVHERLPCYKKELGLVITADVILDNRTELFDKLQVEYSRRHTITDSELIILAYSKWGQDAPKHLVGEYAFMLWDERKQLLFGARDLQGGRTLYYHHNQQRFVFGSTCAPLFTQPEVQKRLNEIWLAEFLAIPITIDSTDVHSTVYHNIRQIPPAHSLTVVDGRVTLTQYGSLVPEETIHFKKDQDYVEAFQDVFQQAVTSKLRTFKRVGATLSGGLDSGAVVAIAAKALVNEGKTLYTYSSVPMKGYVDWTSKSDVPDETPYIQSVVRHVGNIRDSYLDLPGTSPYSEVGEWLDLLETPYKFFENSHWIKGIYEHASQQEVGVMLTGARGNYTISWGSAIDYYALLLKRLRWIPLYHDITMFGRNTGVSRSRIMKVVGRTAFPTWFHTDSEHLETPPLIHPDFAKKTDIFTKLRFKDVGLTPSNVGVLEERQSYFNNLSVLNLQGTIGAKLSLKYGIWERDPTCDPRVVRFCLSVPFEQYVRNGMGRSLVRRATERDLPDHVRLNFRSRGFQGADWIQRMAPSWEAFTNEIKELCRDSMASEILNVRQIRDSLAKLGDTPRPEYASNPDARVLMRSIMVYRFMKALNPSLKGGEIYAKETMASS